jgi:dolichol-phosphate mannosyltransferase
MPVYNERNCIESVILEWYESILETKIPFVFCVLNDGSKDDTLLILNNLKDKFPNLHVVDKQNSGHGQTCVFGYKMAIENGADWIFQIDSDGQCDPKFFKQFIEKIEDDITINVFGNRVTRDDGYKRTMISKFVTLFTFLATKVWVNDANVPYRLMNIHDLKKVIYKIPEDFYLANICLSVLLKKVNNIHWISIHFNERRAGVPSVKTFSFVKHGFKLYRQLREAIN